MFSVIPLRGKENILSGVPVCSLGLQTNAGNEPDAEDEQVCCEALEVMTLCFALTPTALDALSKEKAWQTFIIDLLLHCQSKSVAHTHTHSI